MKSSVLVGRNPEFPFLRSVLQRSMICTVDPFPVVDPANPVLEAFLEAGKRKRLRKAEVPPARSLHRKKSRPLDFLSHMTSGNRLRQRLL